MVAVVKNLIQKLVNILMVKWINIWNVTQNTFSFDTTGGVPLSVNDAHTFVSATTGGLKRVKEHIKLTTGALTFKCAEDNFSTEHSYPRALVDTHTATNGTTYDPNTGIMKVTTTAAHGMRNGDWVKISEKFHDIQLWIQRC